MRIAPLFLLACACSSEVVALPTPGCDESALAGPVDSSEALSIARCLVGEEAALLSLDGTGSGAEASEGRLSQWDVVLFGDGVVHGVGIAAGLEAGTAEYPPESLFPGGSCSDVLSAPAGSDLLVPHAASAGLSPFDDAIHYRIGSDCLEGGTTHRIVVSEAADRLLYSAEGQLVESCLSCGPADARDCCTL